VSVAVLAVVGSGRDAIRCVQDARVLAARFRIASLQATILAFSAFVMLVCSHISIEIRAECVTHLPGYGASNGSP